MSLFPEPSEPKLAPDVPIGLGRAIIGAAGNTDRRANDYYPTPKEATQALLRVERDALMANLNAGEAVWEPCGRGGAIAKILLEAGLNVVSTDIVEDPENNVAQADLLLVKAALSGVVITNPPFALAPKMISYLLGELKVKYLALLLKTTFWSADRRRALLKRHPVARRYDMTWRLDFIDGGAPTMECSWFVWDARADRLMDWFVLPREGTAIDLFGGAE